MMTPFNRLLQGNDAVQRMLDPVTRHGANALDHLINREALIIAYNNDYMMMTFMVIPCLLLLPIMKRPERRHVPVTVPAPIQPAAAPAE